MVATKCTPKNGVCDLLVDWRDFEGVCFSIPSRDGQILTSFFAIFGPFCMWIHTHVSACSQKCACFACCRIPNTLPKPWYQFTETWQALTRSLLCLAQFSAAGWPRENQLPITGNSLSATLESLHFLWIGVTLSHQNFYQSMSFFTTYSHWKQKRELRVAKNKAWWKFTK